MNLIKKIWTEKDIKDFSKYLKSFSKGEEKGIWEQRIVNTKIPCIAVPSDIVRKIIKEISKGNFISFIDCFPWNNHTETIIVGNLICNIKNFETFKFYLDKYSNKIDNWASCDSLKFKIKEENKKLFFNLAQEYIKKDKPFVRRIGLLILFKLIKDKEFLDKIFDTLNMFYQEKEYYVNMMLSWILCECFIQHREKTLNYLKNHNLNSFVINKGISKCRDSFRVNKEDKEFLLKFKVK